MMACGIQDVFAEFIAVILDTVGETTDFETWYVCVHWLPIPYLTIHSIHILASRTIFHFDYISVVVIFIALWFVLKRYKEFVPDY